MNISELFLPKWNFFDRLGTVSVLLFRPVMSEGNEWLVCFEKPKRYWWNLFFNPIGNLYLFNLSLVDRLVHEAYSSATNVDLTSLSSYSNIEIQVKEQIKIKFPTTGQFEFKIQVKTDADPLQDYLVSGVLDV